MWQPRKGYRVWESCTAGETRHFQQTQLQRYQDQIYDLITNQHVPSANDPGKDTIVMIIEKNTTHGEEEFH